MQKKSLNRPLSFFAAVAISALSAFALSSAYHSQENVTLQSPTIKMTGVAGTSRVISIVKATPTDSVVYYTSDTIATYHEPFLLSKSDTIFARTCFTDTVYNKKGEEEIRRYYSPFDTLYVEAGMEVKLNAVSFEQNMIELVDDLSYVKLHTDQSDVLLAPEATIMYRMTNHTWIEVPNDSIILSNEGKIAAYAKAPGYANSDTTYYTVAIQRLEYVGVPTVEILSHNADGSKTFLIKNSVKGYPVPTIYYSYPNGAEPVALQDSILVTPAGSCGWLQVYADAPGYDASAAYRIYLDNRTQYKEPYQTVLPGDTILPAMAGDLELWDVTALDVTNYPEQNVPVSGTIYYHKKMHGNYNTIVLPFLYNPVLNVVTDETGAPLTFGTDFTLYEIGSTLSAENLESGALSASLIYPAKSYLMKVDPKLIGHEVVFRSTVGTALEVTQNTFSTASKNLTPIANNRAQKAQIDNSCYILNPSGTAFELKTNPLLAAFDVALFAPIEYKEQHASISLNYQPELQFNPASGAELDSLYKIIVSAPAIVSKFVLLDEEYLEGGSKKLQVLKNGNASAITAQLTKRDAKSYTVTLSNVVKAEASYTIKFPASLFGFFMSDNSTNNPDNLSSECAVVYNVMSPTTVTINPADQSTQTSLKDFTITFNKQIGLNNSEENITFENSSGDVLASFSTEYIRNKGWINGTKLTISLPTAITSGGSYVLRIPKEFLTLSGVFTNSTEYVFRYRIPVTENFKYFSNDSIIWTNFDNVQSAYNDGWMCSDTETNAFGYTFVETPNYIILLDPSTRTTFMKSLSAVKAGFQENEKFYMRVKNVKSILVYFCNNGSWTYVLDVRAVSENNYIGTYASALSYQSSYCQIDIDPDEETTVSVFSYKDAPVYIYAVEIVYRNGSIAGAGIESVFEDDKTDARIFDMQGREIAEPVKGQMYIRDGKKFIVR